MRTGIVSSCAMALFLAGATAHAANDARQHFEAGKKLRDDGDCPKAIPEFEKSIGIERSIGALYNLGFCHEQLGNRQEAYDAYRSAQQLASAKKDDRLREISGSLATLLETPHIRLALPHPLPPGIKVTVDGQVVPASMYQTETVVFTKQPGKTHQVVVTAPGYDERRELVESKQLKAIELRPVGDKSTTAVQREAGPWHWQRWLGLGIGVAGLGAFVWGAIEGVVYLNERSDLDERIANNACLQNKGGCPAGASPAVQSEAAEIRDANNALIEEEGNRRLRALLPLIVGTLAMGTGIAVFVTAPVHYLPTTAGSTKPSTPASSGSWTVVPNVGMREQGLSIVGRF